MNNPAGEAYQQRQQEEAQAQQAAEEAQRRAQVPQDETNAIITKHALAAAEEINQRAQLTANGREVEQLQAKLEAISKQMEGQNQRPHLYSKAERAAVRAEWDTVNAQIQRLTPPAPKKEQTEISLDAMRRGVMYGKTRP